MAHVRLPSGMTINMDLVTTVIPNPNGDDVTVSFAHPDMDLALGGADADMLRVWCSKRGMLIPPPKGVRAPRESVGSSGVPGVS